MEDKLLKGQYEFFKGLKITPPLPAYHQGPFFLSVSNSHIIYTQNSYFICILKTERIIGLGGLT